MCMGAWWGSRRGWGWQGASGGRRSGDAGRGGKNRRDSPRTRRHRDGTAPVSRPLSAFLAPLSIPAPVSPRYFGRRAPRPVTSPSVRSLPGCCDRELSKHPCPASSLSDYAHPAGVQVPGSHPALASGPRPLEGHPVRPPRAGQVRWGPQIGWNPELGASPGAGHEARSREATPARGGVAADAGEPPRLCRAQLVLPGKWGPSRFGGLAAKCGGRLTHLAVCLPACLLLPTLFLHSCEPGLVWWEGGVWSEVAALRGDLKGSTTSSHGQ